MRAQLARENNLLPGDGDGDGRKEREGGENAILRKKEGERMRGRGREK